MAVSSRSKENEKENLFLRSFSSSLNEIYGKMFRRQNSLHATNGKSKIITNLLYSFSSSFPSFLSTTAFLAFFLRFLSLCEYFFLLQKTFPSSTALSVFFSSFLWREKQSLWFVLLRLLQSLCINFSFFENKKKTHHSENKECAHGGRVKRLKKSTKVLLCIRYCIYLDDVRLSRKNSTKVFFFFHV